MLESQNILKYIIFLEFKEIAMQVMDEFRHIIDKMNLELKVKKH